MSSIYREVLTDILYPGLRTADVVLRRERQFRIKKTIFPEPGVAKCVDHYANIQH